MEITKKAKFVTDFYGGKGYLSGDVVVQNWLESQADRLLHPRFRDLKNALGNETKLEEILSVFNVDGNGRPVIGNWMLFECSRGAAKVAGIWTKFQVSYDVWQNSVQFTPSHVGLMNGRKITKPDFVEVYTVSLKDRSFFKAYQVIKRGAEFEFRISFPEDLCTKVEGRGKAKEILPDEEKSTACVEAVLDKMASVGLGAYRRRFGKFEYIAT